LSEGCNAGDAESNKLAVAEDGQTCFKLQLNAQ
jgi:hypothetical protein